MIQWERIVAGCVIVVVGLGLCFMGYQKMQPTISNVAFGLLEELSGETTSGSLRSDRIQGYGMMGIGALAGLGGLSLILNSRARATP